MGGNVTLVSMRDIAVGEGPTIDYALFLGHPEFEMTCHCTAPVCRGRITGSDWRRDDLQQRYRGWFAWWLQRRIDELRQS